MESMNKSEAESALSSVLDGATTSRQSVTNSIIILTKLIYSDTKELIFASGDLCRSLLKCLCTHPDLGSKVAEVFGVLARECM